MLLLQILIQTWTIFHVVDAFIIKIDSRNKPKRRNTFSAHSSRPRQGEWSGNPPRPASAPSLSTTSPCRRQRGRSGLRAGLKDGGGKAFLPATATLRGDRAERPALAGHVFDGGEAAKLGSLWSDPASPVRVAVGHPEDGADGLRRRRRREGGGGANVASPCPNPAPTAGSATGSSRATVAAAATSGGVQEQR
jgi:hypothetical protein